MGQRTERFARRMVSGASVLWIGSCAMFDSSGPRVVLTKELHEAYSATHDASTDQFEVTMLWEARFGKRVQACRLADLDLVGASTEAVAGGAFPGTVLVTLPGRGAGRVVIRAWGPGHGEGFPERPEAVSWTDNMMFHCPTADDAEEAIKELRGLQ